MIITEIIIVNKTADISVNGKRSAQLYNYEKGRLTFEVIDEDLFRDWSFENFIALFETITSAARRLEEME